MRRARLPALALLAWVQAPVNCGATLRGSGLTSVSTHAVEQRSANHLPLARLRKVGGRDGGTGAPRDDSTLSMRPGHTLLIVGTLDGGVHALSGTSGDLLWSFHSGSELISSSALTKLQAMEEQQQQQQQQQQQLVQHSAATGAVQQQGATLKGASSWPVHDDALGEGDLLHDPGSEWSVSDVEEEEDVEGNRPPFPPRRMQAVVDLKDTTIAEAVHADAGANDEAQVLSNADATPKAPSPDMVAPEGDARVGTTSDASSSEEFEPLIFPALDGSIYVLGEDDQPHQLGEHTIQELVAMPTIFGEDVLVGRRTTKLYALDTVTGQPHYYTDTASSEGDVPVHVTPSNSGKLLVSRSDYSVRVIEPSNGKQRWNVSVGQYSIEVLRPENVEVDSQTGPVQQMRLHIVEGNAVCASVGYKRSDHSNGDGCAWSRSFSSPPVLLYHIDKTSGQKQKLRFVPRLAASSGARHTSNAVIDLLSPSPDGNLVAVGHHQPAPSSSGELVQVHQPRSFTPWDEMHPLLPMLPQLGRLLPMRRKLLDGDGSVDPPSRLLALPTPSDPRWVREAFHGSSASSAPFGMEDDYLGQWNPVVLEGDPQSADDLLSGFSVRQLLLVVERRLFESVLENRLLAAIATICLVVMGHFIMKRRREARALELEEVRRVAYDVATSSTRTALPSLLDPLDLDGTEDAGESSPSNVAHELAPTKDPSSSSSAPPSPVVVSQWPPPPPLPSRYREEFKQDIRLGKGGFGQVYRAKHALDGVEYAVKKVLLTGSVREQERAVREATCLAKLDHPNVVRYYQVWKEQLVSDVELAEFASSDEEFDEYSMTDETQETSEASIRSRRGRLTDRMSKEDHRDSAVAQQPAILYIQMQLCELTMRQWLETDRRDATLEANRPYLIQILRGLNHIHQASLIHRDLTPANVFITHDKGGEKTFKIGDFGLSREMSADMPINVPSVLSALDAASLTPPVALESQKKVSQRGARGPSRQVTKGVGTTLYMSPEQRKSLPYDHKVDVYSLGIILLEMCYPVRTQMERYQVLSKLQNRQLPDGIKGTPVADLVLWFISELPGERPAVAEILASPLLAPHTTIRVLAERSRMHALMPAIHELIERVQRVRSFSAQDAEHEDVSLEYYIEPADDELSKEAARSALEKLHAEVMDLEGVKDVNASGYLLRSSPLPSPGVQPAPSPASFPPPEKLVLPPTKQPVNGGKACAAASSKAAWPGLSVANVQSTS